MASASGRTKLSTLRAKYPRGLEEFDREVKDYCDANRLDDAGSQWRREVRDFVYDQVVCTVFKPGGANTVSLHLVGSSVNGCGLRNSDMDLCLMIAEKSGTYPTHKSFVVMILGMLREALRSSRSAQVTFGKPQLLRTAKVSILKFTVSYSGKTLSVDICVNQFASIDNTRLLRHYAE
ncbi:PAP/25A associated domain containing protein [Aphelenchoides avenae]|nr:PAP/25A associated domain containing protein [Aphelenchus avenae]